MRLIYAICIFLPLASCGPLKGPGSGSGNPFYETLNYIKDNGFPTIATLFPSLPTHFSFIEGVETDGSGLPGLPDNLENSTLGANASSFNNLVGEAKTLSAQGFSEARRMEALVQNLISPVFDILGKSDVFTSALTGTSPGVGLITQETGATAVANVFDELFSNLKFAIALPKVEGMPSHLVLSAAPGSDFISISGIWPGLGEGLVTGFHVDLRLISPKDFELKFALSPSLLGGMVPTWGASECAGDLWQVKLVSTADNQTAQVSSLECPDSRNATSAMSITVGDGMMTINGGFAQTFDDKQNTLRGWLGARQGFVMQATSDTDFDRIAAAAAVLKEGDFAAPSQDTIDQFGVGRLLNSYIQDKYWAPTLKSVKSGPIYTNPSNLENIAYWMCKSDLASSIKSSASEAKTLCKGEEVAIDPLIGIMTALKKEANSSSLVPSDIKSAINGIIDVLTIRNAIFVTTEGQVEYQKAPDDQFAALNDARSASGINAVADLSWKEGVQTMLPNLTTTELPPSSFGAVGSAVTSFLGAGCDALVHGATEKANKSADTSSYCTF